MIKKNKKKLWIIGLLIAATAIMIIAWFAKLDKFEFAITTATVEKGNLSNTITATGTLEATNTVVVGTQSIRRL